MGACCCKCKNEEDLDNIGEAEHNPAYTRYLQIQHANTQATPRQALQNKENIAFSIDRKKRLTVQDVSRIQKMKAPQFPSHVAQNFGKTTTPQVNPKSTKPVNKSVHDIAEISSTILPTTSTWNNNPIIDALQKNMGQSNIINPPKYKINCPKNESDEIRENGVKLKIPTINQISQLENESQERLLFGQNRDVQDIAEAWNSNILFKTLKWKTNPTTDSLQKNVGQSNIISTKYKTSLPKTESSAIKESEGKLKVITTIHHRNQLESDSRKERLLFGSKKVMKNMSMLQELLQALNIPQLYIPIKKTYFKTVLDEDSKQYRFVKWHFRNKKFNSTYKIQQIEQVWNPYIFLQYKLMKDKFDKHFNVRILFHGTKRDYLDSILTYNFDWRKARDGMYGWGIYFANNPWYASHYSVKQQDKNKYCVMILARVLIGQTSLGNDSAKVPIVGDTTTNRDGQVLVKYDDAYFYPEFIIYFEKYTTDSHSFSSADDLTLPASATGANQINKFSGYTEANDYNGTSKIVGTKIINKASSVKGTFKNIGPVKPKNVGDSREPLGLVESAGVILSPRQFMMPFKPNGLLRSQGLGIPIRSTQPRGFGQPNVSVVRSRTFISSSHRPRRF